MDLIQLGAQMRQERERRKLSLADVTEATKISRRILVAFENGEKEHFPHPVYAKGFIRNYAKLLGLDPQDCVRVLEREYHLDDSGDEVRENVGISVKDLSDPSGRSSSRGRNWVTLGVVFLLLVILGGLVWYMARGDGSKTEVPATTSSAAVENPAVPEVEAPELSPEKVQQDAAVQTGEPGEADDAPSASVEASAGMEAGSSDSDRSAVQTTPGKHLLVVTAKEELCWVGVFRRGEEDGETPWVAEFTVRPGQDVRYEFSGTRKFRFGRLETVTLELDGKARPTNGSGVVDITLP